MAYKKLNDEEIEETEEVTTVHKKDAIENRKLRHQEEIAKIDEMLALF